MTNQPKGITMINLDRITHPLRLAAGSHEEGSGKGCAMNVISYINGDTRITDYPECSARPLSRMVQVVNDRLAGDDGFLSPADSVTVMDLGWLTVGTAGVPPEVVWQWLADILVDPERGVVKYAQPEGAVTIRRVAALYVRKSVGDRVGVTEWRDARAEAGAAAWAAAGAAAGAEAGAEAWAEAGAEAAAWAAAAGIDFTRWAILRWRELAGLNQSDIDTAAVDTALGRISCTTT